MKDFLKQFIFRGGVSAAGGPLVLAVIYGILDATLGITLTGGEVCLGILTITALAFAVAGLTALYQIDRLPLFWAILIHGSCLYGIYLGAYLLNGWLQPGAIWVYTAIFLAGYGLIWLTIYFITRHKAKKLNALL